MKSCGVCLDDDISIAKVIKSPFTKLAKKNKQLFLAKQLDIQCQNINLNNKQIIKIWREAELQRLNLRTAVRMNDKELCSEFSHQLKACSVVLNVYADERFEMLKKFQIFLNKNQKYLDREFIVELRRKHEKNICETKSDISTALIVFENMDGLMASFEYD